MNNNGTLFAYFCLLYQMHAGRHPGAIIAASRKLEQWHLLTHEDDYLQDIAVQLQRCGCGRIRPMLAREERVAAPAVLFSFTIGCIGFFRGKGVLRQDSQTSVVAPYKGVVLRHAEIDAENARPVPSRFGIVSF